MVPLNLPAGTSAATMAGGTASGESSVLTTVQGEGLKYMWDSKLKTIKGRPKLHFELK